METLKEYFKKAVANKTAIGHFNFSTADQLKAFVETAKEMDLPIIAGTSEGEAKFFGYFQAVALVRSWRMMGYPVFLNADHHKSWESAKAAIDAGYDTVLIDGSALPFEQNAELTKKVVDYARSIHHEIELEGELGYLRGESQVQKKVEISQNDYTKPEEASNFIKMTGVDRLAIAFGNIHGIVTEQKESLHMPTLLEIAKAVPDTFLVLHGGSGLDSQEVKTAIKNGISNVHINTELRVAYHDALADEFKKEPMQTTPYKFLEPSYEATKKIIREKLELFSK